MRHHRRTFIRNAAFAPFLFKRLLDVPLGKAVSPLAIATWGPNTSATAAAYGVISQGGHALDAVEAGAKIAEANVDDTSVGYGGFPDRDGFVTLDASIMDELGNAGSVCFLEDIQHPISVARRVMEKTPHVMLAGAGARQFALEEGFPVGNLLTPQARKALDDWKETALYKPVINVERHDTIGILAMDQSGRICGACSTSGQAFKMRGRVGDSPIIGAGLFVDGQVGAATCTGLGELTLKTLGCFLLVEEMRRGASPMKAAERVIRRIVQKYPEQTRDAQVGFVAIDRKGRYGAFSIHRGFNFALSTDGQPKVIEAGCLL